MRVHSQYFELNMGINFTDLQETNIEFQEQVCSSFALLLIFQKVTVIYPFGGISSTLRCAFLTRNYQFLLLLASKQVCKETRPKGRFPPRTQILKGDEVTKQLIHLASCCVRWHSASFCNIDLLRGFCLFCFFPVPAWLSFVCDLKHCIP